ncbi:MAG: aminotransferase class V-fold PLP-dependent enzyme [Candidatus Acidiferrales bacterium]
MDYRKEFADFEGVAYLDCATQGAFPLSAAVAAKVALEWKKRPDQLPAGIYFDLPNRVREKIAKLVGAEAADIALTTGATSGATAVAAGMDFKPGDEVLVAKGEFPMHFSTWVPYQRAGRMALRIIEPRGRFITADDYIENLGPKTRLVSASFVRFDNGARLDAKKLAKTCRERGIAFLLDLSQGAGAVPIELTEWGVDFATSSGYKWLLGPYGTGFFWVNPTAKTRLELGPVYWMSIEGSDNFSGLPITDLKVQGGARRWDAAETGSFSNLTALDASLDFVLRVGVEEIARELRALVEEIIERLPRDRCVLASPAEAGQRGPYVCVMARKPEETALLHQRLREAQVVAAMRENAIRISPYLYNTSDHVTRLIKALSL